MELPVELSKVFVKSGGRVTRVTGFTHVEDKPQDGRSRDYWHFLGDIQWNDAPPSEGMEIAPYTLCADSGINEPELAGLFEIMNEYLAAHGEWCDRKSKHEGWYATRTQAKIRRRA